MTVLVPTYRLAFYRGRYRDKTFHPSTALPELAKRPDDFREWTADGHASAKQLETLLRTRKNGGGIEPAMLESIYTAINADCTRCHAKYRDMAK